MDSRMNFCDLRFQRRSFSIMSATILLILALGLTPCTSRAQDQDASTQDLAGLISQKMERIEDLGKESKALANLVKNESRSLANNLETAKAKYSTMVLERGFERYSPFESRQLNERLGALIQIVTKFTTPLEQLLLKISMNKENLDAILNEVDTIDMSSLDREERTNVDKYLNKVKSMEKTLSSLQKRVKNAIEASQAFKEKLKNKSKSLEEGIPALWGRFLLSKSHSVLTMEYWQSLPGYWSLWLVYINDQVSSLTFLPAKEYYNALLSLIALTGIVFTICAWVRRHVIRYLPSDTGKEMQGSTTAIFLFSLGLSFTIVSLGDNVDISGPARFMGSVLQSWGAIRFSWILKRCFMQTNGKMPLVPSFAMFCLGLMFLGIGFPNTSLCLVWGILMSIMFFFTPMDNGYGMWGKFIAYTHKPLCVILALLSPVRTWAGVGTAADHIFPGDDRHTGFHNYHNHFAESLQHLVGFRPGQNGQGNNAGRFHPPGLVHHLRGIAVSAHRTSGRILHCSENDLPGDEPSWLFH